MQVILVRHAKALDRIKALIHGVKDPDRPLTKKGIFKFQTHVKKNKRLFEKVDLFVTSPYLRAVQTLDIILDELKINEADILIFKKITPDDQIQYLNQWLKKRTEKKIVITSHEPFMSNFMRKYCYDMPPDFKIKKGDILILDFDIKSGLISSYQQTNRA